jgi:hypothetical protein
LLRCKIVGMATAAALRNSKRCALSAELNMFLAGNRKLINSSVV